MASFDALTFPAGFLWGTATASHQYEGGNTNNQWYAWEQAGHIKSGETCGLACDWWAHAERDFDRAAQMGLKALRLSLEWSRIEPAPGQWDTAALDRYHAMLVGLRQRDIIPLVTLHHFTHPIWLEAIGGFLAPDFVRRFIAYTGRVVEALGDQCDWWCTINEPNVVSVAGYQIGNFPPGRRGDLRGAIRAQAALVHAHAAAYHEIHRQQPEARVGWAQHIYTFDPANPRSPLDRTVTRLQDLGFNDFFPRAVLTGKPLGILSPLTGDLSAAKGTCDYVGINCYARAHVAFDPRIPSELFGRRFSKPGTPLGDAGPGSMFTEMYPDGILRNARRFQSFGKPIYFTENGVPDASDHLRPWIIARAARALHDALREGIDVRGYLHWSLVDNFEWENGWTMRFGLIALDEHTQERAPRPSAALYGELAQANALTRDMVTRYAPTAEREVFGTA
ncbi:MAG TPA: family 1 glycosylhydrolase [Ktedonobacterales bacterium]